MDATLPARRPERRLESSFRWLYQTLAFFGVLATFALVFFVWNLISIVLYRVMPRDRSARFGQAAMSWGFRNLLRLMSITGLARFDLTALDALRDEPGLVIAPNHPTLLDALLVTSRLPRIVCITKASLWDNPALGASCRLSAYIRNDSSHKLVRRAAEAMKGGSQLLIFPEGTRTITPPIGPFKAGFALMARQAGVPVQTVLLQASSPYLQKGWPLWRRPDFPLTYRARLGRRFTVNGPAEAFSDQLAAYFRAELGDQ